MDLIDFVITSASVQYWKSRDKLSETERGDSFMRNLSGRTAIDMALEMMSVKGIDKKKLLNKISLISTLMDDNRDSNFGYIVPFVYMSETRATTSSAGQLYIIFYMINYFMLRPFPLPIESQDLNYHRYMKSEEGNNAEDDDLVMLDYLSGEHNFDSRVPREFLKTLSDIVFSDIKRQQDERNPKIESFNDRLKEGYFTGMPKVISPYRGDESMSNVLNYIRSNIPLDIEYRFTCRFMLNIIKHFNISVSRKPESIDLRKNQMIDNELYIKQSSEYRWLVGTIFKPFMKELEIMGVSLKLDGIASDTMEDVLVDCIDGLQYIVGRYGIVINTILLMPLIYRMLYNETFSHEPGRSKKNKFRGESDPKNTSLFDLIENKTSKLGDMISSTYSDCMKDISTFNGERTISNMTALYEDPDTRPPKYISRTKKNGYTSIVLETEYAKFDGNDFKDVDILSLPQKMAGYLYDLGTMKNIVVSMSPVIDSGIMFKSKTIDESRKKELESKLVRIMEDNPGKIHVVLIDDSMGRTVSGMRLDYFIVDIDDKKTTHIESSDKKRKDVGKMLSDVISPTVFSTTTNSYRFHPDDGDYQADLHMFSGLRLSHFLWNVETISRGFSSNACHHLKNFLHRIEDFIEGFYSLEYMQKMGLFTFEQH